MPSTWNYMGFKLHVQPFHVIIERHIVDIRFDRGKSISILNKTQDVRLKQLHHLKGKTIC